MEESGLYVCNIPVESLNISPFVMVIFGGTGDLSQKKLLPALFHTFVDHRFPHDSIILGVGTRPRSIEEYREFAMESVRKNCREKPGEGCLASFASHISYLPMDVTREEHYELLHNFLKEHESAKNGIIYYLAVQPEFSPVIIEKLNAAMITARFPAGKVVMEKPFGWDRPSAEELNGIALAAFREQNIFRIDHYLAKDTVQNIMFFRFSNSIFEPLWNRLYIDHVQITVAEEIGIGARGRFYEKTGVVRDIVQNHLLQLIALTAMEPPAAFEADLIRNERVKVFRALRPMNDETIDRLTVRGQYGPGRIGGEAVRGYREEELVDRGSATPTFFAGVFHIDNWRWAGVPFYVRAGKRLASGITRISIHFKQPPLKLFSSTCDTLDPDVLVLTIQPEERISIHFGVKYPGKANTIYPVTMDFNYDEAFHIRRHPPYEKILVDLMKGDLTLFARQDEIEAAWSVVDPITKRWDEVKPGDFPDYEAGTWGPPEAAELIQRDGRMWL
ncbi:MAG: glucose-6-phosphate dehydrogenase [Candidatus Eremiobacteraeota bacterium]|nr:glucose-6-phosphate dehydrogenase [Candidatus Eremiobacteraeota bacterium]